MVAPVSFFFLERFSSFFRKKEEKCGKKKV